MNQPAPISYQTTHKIVVANTPEDIVKVDGVRALDGGMVMNNSKTVRLLVAIDNKPELARQVNTWLKSWDAYKAYKAAKFAENVPGLNELRKAQETAYNDRALYVKEFGMMMDDENNDGVNPPAPISENIQEVAIELAKLYPRAACYLQAENYTYASNDKKYAAGKHAMQVLADGGSIQEAQKIMNDWINR